MTQKVLESHQDQRRDRLRSLLVQIKKADSAAQKLEILNALPEVDAYFSFPSPLKTFLSGLAPECEYVIKAAFAIGQGPRLFERGNLEDGKLLRALLED